MARYTETLLTPLHARLEAQAERIGRLEEQLEAARARIAELEAPGSEAQNGPAVAQPAPEQHRWWQRLLWG